jgi:hypothetical protein
MDTVSAELAEQWNALRTEMLGAGEREIPLAGLFRGFKPVGFDEQRRRILLIGKATAGDFNGQEAHEQSFNGKSAFWQLGRRLSQSAGNADGEMTNVAWSNVTKIGVAVGNPSESLQLAQAALASKTLRQEIGGCNPSLVVFASDGYADDIVYDALKVRRGGANDFETRPSPHAEFYVRRATQEGAERLPGMLWIKHPQGKPKELWDEWVGAAETLLAEAE